MTERDIELDLELERLRLQQLRRIRDKNEILIQLSLRTI